ncbi:MAG: phosphotransferase [Polyangia bacterium]
MQLEPLYEKVFGEPVEPVGFTALEGDASSRRYHRAVFGPGQNPKSLVVMELPDDPLGSDEAQGDRPDELPFLDVGRHLAAAGLPVPRVLADGVELGALLLEDLGDTTLVKRIEGLERSGLRDWYLAAVDLLSRLHDAMWPVPDGCLAARRRFDYGLLRWELDHYREWGAEALAGRELPPAVRERLDSELDRLARDVESLPLGFVHRDYQSRNLMVTGEQAQPESLVIIDFQDAMVGPRVYDLVALLNDSYVELDDELKSEIVERYAATRGIDAGELRRELDLVTVQRKLKDGGRFVFIDRVKGDPSFLPFVDASFARVRRALERLPDRAELRAALAEADPAHFG